MSFTPGRKIENEIKYGRDLKLLFLFWPFVSFILALKNFGNKQARSVVIAFFSFFGFTMNLGREGLDGARHVEIFKSFKDTTYSEFGQMLSDFIYRRSGGNEVDFYTTFVNFIFSRFTDSYHYVFLFHAFLYSYFYVNVFGVIYDEFNSKMNKNAFFFFCFSFFILPVSTVHGIRFPIATWIYIYGVYQFLRTEKRNYLIYCFMSCFVHFSFLLGVALIGIYYFLRNRNTVYLGILAVSVIVPNLLFSYLGKFDSGDLGGGLQDKVKAYSREDYIKARNEAIEGRNWYARLRIPIMEYTIVSVLTIIGFIKRKYYEQDKVQQNLLSFLILLLAFVNFGLAFDSLGRRFLVIWFVFAIIYIYRFFQINNYQHYSIYTFVFIFPVLIWVFVQIRISLEIATYMWFLGNPLTAAFIELGGILK